MNGNVMNLYSGALSALVAYDPLRRWGFAAAVVGLLLAWAYSAPPLRLKQNGWWGNTACAACYEGLPWITGAAVMAGDKSIGTMGSTAAHHGLALIRIDRAADALQAGNALTAGGIPIRLAEPDDLSIAPRQTVA